MYKLQLLLLITWTDKVLEKPTVIVPKSKSFGLILITPSLPAPIISRSYLTATSFIYFVVESIVLFALYITPEPGL